MKDLLFCRQCQHGCRVRSVFTARLFIHRSDRFPYPASFTSNRTRIKSQPFRNISTKNGLLNTLCGSKV